MIAKLDISVKPNMSPHTLEPMRAADWPIVRAIYLEGIAKGEATFETEAPSWEEWDAAHLSFARLVARAGDSLSGWAALSPVSRRTAYAGVAEVSAYVASQSRGQGVGTALLERLIEESDRTGFGLCKRVCFRKTRRRLRFTNDVAFVK